MPDEGGRASVSGRDAAGSGLQSSSSPLHTCLDLSVRTVRQHVNGGQFLKCEIPINENLYCNGMVSFGRDGMAGGGGGGLVVRLSCMQGTHQRSRDMSLEYVIAVLIYSS